MALIFPEGCVPLDNFPSFCAAPPPLRGGAARTRRGGWRRTWPGSSRTSAAATAEPLAPWIPSLHPGRWFDVPLFRICSISSDIIARFRGNCCPPPWRRPPPCILSRSTTLLTEPGKRPTTGRDPARRGHPPARSLPPMSYILQSRGMPPGPAPPRDPPWAGIHAAASLGPPWPDPFVSGAISNARMTQCTGLSTKRI